MWQAFPIHALLLVSASVLADSNTVPYCIVGAGPAGLQLGHFLKHAGRDYVIFESNAKAGEFFRKFPRHRRLISLNKRFVRDGRSEEFAMRHDWNSLLDVRPKANQTPRVTTRSKDLFPHADVLADYLAEFAEEQGDAIKYSTRVSNISRDSLGLFMLTLKSMNGRTISEAVYCQEVIVSSGFWTPRSAKAAIDGDEYLEGYANTPEMGDTYEGKSVVILGLGNAALETAQSLQPFTAEVHVYGRSRALPEGGKGVRFAYQTHYVGDIRAGRTQILDTYLLKSLDSFDFDILNDGARFVVIPCLGGRRCMWHVFSLDCMDDECVNLHGQGGQNLRYSLHMFKFAKGGKVSREVTQIMNKHVPQDAVKDWEIVPSPIKDDEHETNATENQERMDLGIDDWAFDGEFEELVIASTLLRRVPSLLDALMPLRERHTSDPQRYPMDHVIRCFGWVLDASIFDRKSVPLMLEYNGKYPKLTSNFSAVDVPGLYFAGTLTHGLDFRRSAGGFVHGFRYTARALFRGLEEKNFGVQWPRKNVRLQTESHGTSPVNILANMLLKRINEASGPYQMFQFLGDMVLFVNSESLWTAQYLEEVPLTNFHNRSLHTPRLTWTFRYGDNFYGPAVLGPNRVGSTGMFNAHESTLVHPKIEFFEAGKETSSHALWWGEDIYTTWEEPHAYSPLVRFVAKVVQSVTGDKMWTEPTGFSDDQENVALDSAAPGPTPRDVADL